MLRMVVHKEGEAAETYDWDRLKDIVRQEGLEMLRHLGEDETASWFKSIGYNTDKSPLHNITINIEKDSYDLTPQESEWLDNLKELHADLKLFDSGMHEQMLDDDKKGYVKEVGMRYAKRLRKMYDFEEGEPDDAPVAYFELCIER